MKLFVFWSIFLVSHFVGVLLLEKCSIPLQGEWVKFSPLLYRNNWSLILPDNEGNISLEKGSNITLVCPDPKNYLTITNSNTSYAICEGGETLKVIKTDIQFEVLDCKKIIRGVVEKTSSKESCGNHQGLVYNIGYQLSKKIFFTLIKACYNEESGNALYTEHVLYGRNIKDATKSSYRPSFSPEGVGADISVSIAYKQVYQKSTFNRLLKSSKLASKYINKKSFLARGHLSPDGDFLFAAWQYTSYYYINVVPQWQVINAANWKKIEIMVRKTAGGLNDTFQIITGSFEVLQLPDVDGEMTDIFLVSGTKLAVPKHIWKIVYSKDCKKAIVLIVLNNPFVEEITDEDLLCNDICELSGWGSNSWFDYQRGFVHCCEYEDFAHTVTTAPELDVNGILKGIN